jgi:hypothetical protein
LLVRKDMDVNEREWLSKTLKTQIQVKEQHFIAVLSPRDEIFIVLDMCSENKRYIQITLMSDTSITVIYHGMSLTVL